MKFKTPDQLESDKYRHHTWVLFGFAILLMAIITGLCAFIYVQDVKMKEKRAMKENLHSQNGFTARELLQVTNMRPSYIVEDN